MNKAFIIPAILLFTACGNDPQETAGTGSEHTPTSTTTAASTEDPRDTWQQPAEVLRMIEEGQEDKNLTGKVVADLFCGDGYFTMKLLERGATVIAIDNDEQTVMALKERAMAAGIPEDRLKVRVTAPGEPGITMNEADLALCVNRYTNIPERVEYLKKVYAGLRSHHQLFIIDFKQIETPVGPPMETRMAVEPIMDELMMAGYQDVAASSGTLPYQFIMVGQDVWEANTAPLQ